MKRAVLDLNTGSVVLVNLTSAEIAAAQAATAAEAAAVPPSLSRAQFWQQIEAQGLTASANALIDGLTDPLQRIRAREVTTYVRTDAQLVAMATALGMSSGAIDEFFRQGAAR